jgi:hypothetical protein
MASAAIKRLATADRLRSGGRWPVTLTLLSADISGQGSTACVPIPGLNSFLPPNVPLYTPAQPSPEQGCASTGGARRVRAPRCRRQAHAGAAKTPERSVGRGDGAGGTTGADGRLVPGDGRGAPGGLGVGAGTAARAGVRGRTGRWRWARQRRGNGAGGRVRPIALNGRSPPAGAWFYGFGPDFPRNVRKIRPEYRWIPRPSREPGMSSFGKIEMIGDLTVCRLGSAAGAGIAG